MQYFSGVVWQVIASAVLWGIVCLPSLPGAAQPELAPTSLAQEKDVDRLQQCYLDGNAEMRVKVADRLGELGDARSVDLLILILRDDDARVRATAVQRLARTNQAGGKIGAGGSRVVGLVLAALHDPDAPVRAQAAAALGVIGDQTTLDALLAALRDGDAGVRMEAAQALGGAAFHDPRIADPLFTRLAGCRLAGAPGGAGCAGGQSRSPCTATSPRRGEKSATSYAARRSGGTGSLHRSPDSHGVDRAFGRQ